LVTENNIDMIIESICYLLTHPSEAIAMGKNAQERVLEQHDLVKTTTLKQSYYLELLNETRLS